LRGAREACERSFPGSVARSASSAERKECTCSRGSRISVGTDRAGVDRRGGGVRVSIPALRHMVETIAWKKGRRRGGAVRGWGADRRPFMLLRLCQAVKTVLVEGTLSDSQISCFCSHTLTLCFVRTRKIVVWKAFSFFIMFMSGPHDRPIQFLRPTAISRLIICRWMRCHRRSPHSIFSSAIWKRA